MFKQFPSFKKQTPIDIQIAAVLKQMNEIGVADENYTKMMAYLERLEKVKAHERKPRISRDTMLLVAGNLLGIIVIVAYEQKHVITSKGFPQIIKPTK